MLQLFVPAGYRQNRLNNPNEYRFISIAECFSDRSFCAAFAAGFDIILKNNAIIALNIVYIIPLRLKNTAAIQVAITEIDITIKNPK